MREGQRGAAFGVRFGLIVTVGLTTIVNCSKPGSGASEGEVAIQDSRIAVAVPADSAPAASAGRAGVATDPGVDLSALVDRVHFAFREEKGAFAGSHLGYRSRVAKDGTLSFIPRVRLPSGAPPAEGAPFALETVAVRVGTLSLLTGRASVEVDPSGAVVAHHGGVTESWKNVDEGVEQSWTFASKPTGTEDVTVAVRASGYRHAGTTSGGEHFRGGDSGVRVGVATWIDATGVQTTVRERFDGDTLTYTVPREVIERSTFPAVLDPVISAELAFDQPIAGAAPAFVSSSPAVATAGTDFVALWLDLRDEPAVLHSAHIKTGTTPVVSHQYVGIANSGLGATTAIASDGNGYLGVYGGNQGIFAVKLTATGAPDGEPFLIGSSPFSPHDPRVAFGGGQYFVTWADAGAGNTAILGARVGMDRTVKDRPAIELTSAQGSRSPGVVFNGTDFVVAWAQGAASPGGHDLYAARVSKTGVVQDVRGKLIHSGTVGAISVAGIGTGGTFLASWNASDEVRAAVVDATLVPGTSQKLSTTNGVYDRVSASCDTADCSVGFRQLSSGYTLVVRANKVTALPAAPPIAMLVENTTIGEIASTAAETLFAFVRNTAAGNVYVRRFGHPALVAKDAAPVLASASANDQSIPAVASDGTNYFAVWLDLRAAPGLYAARLGPDGKALDAIAVLVQAGQKYEFSAPRIAYASGVYLVTWQQGSAIYGRRFKTDGAPLDAASFPILATNASYSLAPAIATDGIGFLVACVRDVVSFTTYGVFGAFVGKSGDVSPEFAIFGAESDLVPTSPAALPYSSPALGYGHGRYGAAWAFARGADGAWGVRFRRLALDGVRLDRAPTTLALNARAPAVTFDGENFVVAFDDVSEGDSAPHSRVARVSAESKLLDAEPKRVTGGSTPQQLPSIVSAGPGVGSIVAWEDLRGANGDVDVLGATVDLLGNVLDAEPLAISNAPNVAARSVALGSDGRGHVIAVYSVTDPAPTVLSNRIRARIVSVGAAVATGCTKDDECGSRHCSAGICCDAACNAPCQTCTANPGRCIPVRNAEDPDSCVGNASCNADAKCIGKPGAKCGVASDCESNFCVDGVCCNSACDGACDACDLEGAVGTCTIVPAQGRGNPSCLPFACNGQSAACSTSCADNVDCPFGSACNPGTKECVVGNACTDDHTQKTPLGVVTDCAPYRCAPGGCATRCTSAADCAAPALCNLDGKCVGPGDNTGNGEDGCNAGGSASSSSIWIFATASLIASAARRRRGRPQARR